MADLLREVPLETLQVRSLTHGGLRTRLYILSPAGR